MSPLLRASTAAVAVALAAIVMVPSGASSAATLAPQMTPAEQTQAYALRAAYYTKLNAARANYTAAKLDYPGLATGYTSAYTAVMTVTTKRVGQIANQLSAARELSEYYAVGPKIDAEVKRSVAYRATVRLAADAVKARTAAISAGQAVTRQYLAGQVTSTGYASVSEASGRVAALASADLLRMWSALGTSVTPAPSVAATWVSALDGSQQVPETPGFTPIPGSCALPSASEAWIGSAAAPGLHQWITSSEVADAKARIANRDATFVPVHESLLRQSAKLTTAATTPSDLRLRGQRLGYAWLVAGDRAARDMLIADSMGIISAGPSGRELTDAPVLEAAATSFDWVGLTPASQEKATAAMRNLWLEPFICMIEDRMNMREANNMAAIYNAAIFQAAIYIAQTDPAVGAAVARASWTNMQPSLSALSDGGWYEGPAYWNLMGRAIVGAVSTAQNVYGTNASTVTGSPVTIPDLSPTVNFMWNATSTDGHIPAFADTTNDPLRNHYAFLVIRNSDNPYAMPTVRELLASWTSSAYEALWWPSQAAFKLPTPAKVSTVYPKTGIASVQNGTATAWLKGSSRYMSHTHLDAGMVNLYAQGVAWAVDPGKGDYTAPGYFTVAANSPRWTYYQVSAAAHSRVTGTARPVLGASTPLSVDGTTASVDLRRSLPGTTSASRTVTLNRTSMTMKDAIVATAGQPWTWRWVTEASVTTSGTATAPRFTLTAADSNNVTRRLSLTVTGVPAGSTVTATRTSTLSAEGRPLSIITITTPSRTTASLTTTATW